MPPSGEVIAETWGAVRGFPAERSRWASRGSLIFRGDQT